MPSARLTLLCLLSLSVTAQADTPKKSTPKRRPNNAFAKIEDDPKIPRVLLIGDSISIGYTLAVREQLKGTANVHRIPTNGGPTTRGLEQIDTWLGDKPWDVIHFNWGLHDLKYINDKGGLVAVDQGHQQVPIEQYESNLRKLVERLKKTNAKLIWCETTPVPEGAKGRVVGDSVKYNKVAAKVMKDHGVAIDDLYAFSQPKLAEIQREANVHFSPEGSKKLAEHVVKSIQAALDQ